MITRIEAIYPATDGSAPERIEITWEDGTPPAVELCVLVDALGRVPRRYEIQPPRLEITAPSPERDREARKKLWDKLNKEQSGGTL